MADCDKNGHFFGIANNCVFLLHSYALSFLVSYCTCVFDFEIPLFSMSWLDYVFSVYMFFFCLAFCLCWFFCTCLFKLLLENMKSEHNMMYTYMIYIYIQYIVYIYMWYYIYMSYIYTHITYLWYLYICLLQPRSPFSSSSVDYVGHTFEPSARRDLHHPNPCGGPEDSTGNSWFIMG